MYYNTLYSKKHGISYTEAVPMGYIRVLHAVPNGPNVDIYADNILIGENIGYGEHTDYISVPLGTYQVSLYLAGSMNSPILSNTLTVDEVSTITVAAIGTPNDIEFLAITDSNEEIEEGKAMLRFGHLSPDAPAVDITLPDGTLVFEDVSFKQVTSYIRATQTSYTLEVRLAGTSTVVLTSDINIEPNNYYTVYAIGLVGEPPELEAILLSDGNQYTNFPRM